MFCLPLGRTNCSVLNKIFQFNRLPGQRPLGAQWNKEQRIREAGATWSSSCILPFQEQTLKGLLWHVTGVYSMQILCTNSWHLLTFRNSFFSWLNVYTSMKEIQRKRKTTSLNLKPPCFTRKLRKGQIWSFLGEICDCDCPGWQTDSSSGTACFVDTGYERNKSLEWPNEIITQS